MPSIRQEPEDAKGPTCREIDMPAATLVAVSFTALVELALAAT